MDTLPIRQAIALARAHEQDTNELRLLLERRVFRLHHSIQLPPRNAALSLLEFIQTYIEHVPEFLEALQTAAARANIAEYTDPVIATCTDFFASPPDLLNGHGGLNALMDEAYLAHRLVEEVNDRFIAHCHAPLIPMDMTRSNLIVHHLIGEAFANQLDAYVHLLVDHLTDREYRLASAPAHTAAQFIEAWRTWRSHLPCLTDSMSVSLLMNGYSTVAVH